MKLARKSKFQSNSFTCSLQLKSKEIVELITKSFLRSSNSKKKKKKTWRRVTLTYSYLSCF